MSGSDAHHRAFIYSTRPFLYPAVLVF